MSAGHGHGHGHGHYDGGGLCGPTFMNGNTGMMQAPPSMIGDDGGSSLGPLGFGLGGNGGIGDGGGGISGPTFVNGNTGMMQAPPSMIGDDGGSSLGPPGFGLGGSLVWGDDGGSSPGDGGGGVWGATYMNQIAGMAQGPTPLIGYGAGPNGGSIFDDGGSGLHNLGFGLSGSPGYAGNPGFGGDPAFSHGAGFFGSPDPGSASDLGPLGFRLGGNAFIGDFGSGPGDLGYGGGGSPGYVGESGPGGDLGLGLGGLIFAPSGLCLGGKYYNFHENPDGSFSWEPQPGTSGGTQSQDSLAPSNGEQVEHPDTTQSEQFAPISESAESKDAKLKSQAVEDDYSPGKELVKDVTEGLYFGKTGVDLLKSFDTAQVSQTVGKIAEVIQESATPDFIAQGVTKGTDAIQQSLYSTDGERIRGIANSTGLRVFGGATGGFLEGTQATERGVSKIAAVLDGGVAGTITYWGLPGASPTLGPVEAAVGIVNAVTSAISPEAGEYTKIGADAMPSDVVKKIAVGTIDTIDALVRGDEKQLIRHHEQNLSGQYGEVLRGYAIFAEAIGAAVTGDQRALNHLSDAAAGGKLGKLGQFGDWLGGTVFDLLHDR